MTTTTLVGSEKQIAWAEKIRCGKIESIKTASACNQQLTAIEDCIEMLESIDSASYWINHRENPSFAFLAYAYKKLDLLGEAKGLTYYQKQSVIENGIETRFKLVPVRLGFLGRIGKIIPPDALLNIELHEKTVESEKKIELLKAQEKSIRRTFEENGEITLVSPITKLLDSGWATLASEIIVIAVYLDDNRISGDNRAEELRIRLMDLRLYSAAMRKILLAILYYLKVQANGQTFFKIGKLIDF